MSRPAARLAILSALLLTVACDKVPLLAPTQSTITLSVDTTTVAVNGTAQVSAVITEQSGTPVQNGTLVTFTTTLGTMDPPEARTDRGVARSTFRASGVSGVARITAFSGGVRTAADQQAEIRVGGAAAGRVSLRAEPPNVPTSGGTTTIIATVFDASGNLLPGAPVTFSADAGTLTSAQGVTDAQGEARTSLTTSRQTVVTATVGGSAGTGGAPVTATFTVPAVPLPSVQIATAPGAVLEAGLPIAFTVTPGQGGIGGGTGNPLRQVIVDFGDGSTPRDLGAISAATPVSHSYAARGTYQVTATAIDTQGLRGSSSIVITVNDRGSVQVALTATPNPVSVSNPAQQGLVDFTATATLPPGTTIQSYTWDFGDGTGSGPGSQSSINHRYSAPNTYIASVTVRATNGTTGFAQRTIRVNP